MPRSQLTREEVVRRGEELYRQIHARVNESDQGKYLVIDTETGDYEMGGNYRELAARLHARRRDAPLYTVRIGHRAMGRIGRYSAPEQR